MNADDFFASVDSTLSKKAAATVAAEDKAAANREHLKEVVGRLTPIANTYKAKLRERGVQVELTAHESAISFTLRYKDGGHHGLNLLGNLSDNRIEITTSFTNDDGKNYRSASGNLYDKSTWRDSIFEEALQKVVKDFLFYADRHGGI